MSQKHSSTEGSDYDENLESDLDVMEVIVGRRGKKEEWRKRKDREHSRSPRKSSDKQGPATSDPSPPNSPPKKRITSESPPRKSAVSPTTRKMATPPPSTSVAMETAPPVKDASTVAVTSATFKNPPPAIHIKNITNFSQLTRLLGDRYGHNSFTCNVTSTEVIVSFKKAEDYLAAKHLLSERKYSFYHYAIKEQKPYKVVISKLHHSVPEDEIKKELENMGHKVRQVTNIICPVTKKRLNKFFVLVEPSPSNKDLYSIEYLFHSRVKVEESHPSKKTIQCHNCQSWGHTKNYCHQDPKCVKCGAGHHTQECTKKKEEAPKCANCGGSHPASYRGCSLLKELKSRRTSRTKPKILLPKEATKTPVLSPENFPALPSQTAQTPVANVPTIWRATPKTTQPPRKEDTATPTIQPITQRSATTKKDFKSGISATPSQSSNPQTSSTHNPPQEIIPALSSFLDELKSAILPLISLLTTLISKLVPSLT